MDILNWSIQTSPVGTKRMIVSEYVLNDMGIFIKDEYRMPKNDVLTTITGFRIGYNNIPNTDYHAAPGKRNVILWHKITDIREDETDSFIIKGNKNDVIKMLVHQKDRSQILDYIVTKQKQHPTVIDADRNAAAWMCWRDDDEWEEPYASLQDMIQEEMGIDRFVDDVLEDSVLENIENPIWQSDSFISEDNAAKGLSQRPNFCSECGQKLKGQGSFCNNCGARVN